MGTLLLQGLTLPLLIRRLGVADADEKREDARELDAVRARTSEEGRAYLAEKRAEWEARFGDGFSDRFDRMARSLTRFETDARKAQDAEAGVEGVAGHPAPTYDDFASLSRGWLEVRRRVVIEERDAGNLNEEVMRELIVAMDAEELALDTRGDLRGPGYALTASCEPLASSCKFLRTLSACRSVSPKWRARSESAKRPSAGCSTTSRGCRRPPARPCSPRSTCSATSGPPSCAASAPGSSASCCPSCRTRSSPRSPRSSAAG